MNFMEAFELADTLHEGQFDKAGEEYVSHCFRVAAPLENESDDVVTAALLHDAIEDGKATAESLAEAGVSKRSLELIDILTKRPGVAYEDYLARVKADPDALLIKRADLGDNMNPDRLAKLPADMAAKLLRKYNKALEILNA